MRVPGHQPVFLPLIFLTTCIITVSCISKKNQDAMLESISNSLTQAIQTTRTNSEDIVHQMKNESYNGIERTMMWYQKAIQIQAISNKMSDTIAKYKAKGETNISGFIYLFGQLKIGHEELLAVDSTIADTFQSILADFDISQDSLSKLLPSNPAPPVTKALMIKAEHDIRLNENRLLAFCFHKMPRIMDDSYHSYSAIVAQNFSHLLPGKTLEITAGLGYFKVKKADTRILVNKREMEINELGYVVYKSKVGSRPGNYEIPVTIYFRDENGKTIEISKQVPYTVIPPLKIKQKND